MNRILHTKTKATVYPPTFTGTLVEKGVGYEWMARPEEKSTPTNTARGIFNTNWHMGKGVPKFYYVPEPVPLLQVLHTHEQLPTFTNPSGMALLIYDAASRLGGSLLGNFNASLPNGGFLFRGASHRWGLIDIPCISSGPFGSGPTTLGATALGIENFTVRLLPVLEYAEGYWSMRININQTHFLWWAQQPGSTNGESYFGFHRYTDYGLDRSKQVIPAEHLNIRAAGNWLQFSFLAFGQDTLLIEVLDHEGKALRRVLAYDPDLNVYGKDVEIELEVRNGMLALGFTEHTYSATDPLPSSVSDEDLLNDPDETNNGLALTYPLHTGVEVTNTSTPTGRVFGTTPPGTEMRVYAQRRSGTNIFRPVIALRSSPKRTPILVGAQMVWPSILNAGTGIGREITDLRSAPIARYAKDYRGNRFAMDYAVGTQPHLKGNECIYVATQNIHEDGTINSEEEFFGGFISSYGTGAEGKDSEVTAHLEAQDWLLRLEKKDMADTPCFAGWNLEDAVYFVLDRCGVPNNWLHWEQAPTGWVIPQRAQFKLEFKYDETSTAVEALDDILGACGFTWGTGFNGHIFFWSRAAQYVSYGVTIDDTDIDDEKKIIRLETQRDLEDFANEVLVVTSSLRDKTDPSIARAKNLNSQQAPADDLYVGEAWVKVRQFHDSFPAPLMAALELVRYTQDRRLCSFSPREGRLDIKPRHLVTANVSDHDFPSGTQFAVIGATYSVPEVGGLPRLRSEFVLAKL